MPYVHDFRSSLSFTIKLFFVSYTPNINSRRKFIVVEHHFRMIIVRIFLSFFVLFPFLFLIALPQLSTQPSLSDTHHKSESKSSYLFTIFTISSTTFRAALNTLTCHNHDSSRLHWPQSQVTIVLPTFHFNLTTMLLSFLHGHNFESGPLSTKKSTHFIALSVILWTVLWNKTLLKLLMASS